MLYSSVKCFSRHSRLWLGLLQKWTPTLPSAGPPARRQLYRLRQTPV